MIQIKHCWKMSEFSWPSWIDPQSSPITSTLGFIHEKKKTFSIKLIPAFLCNSWQMSFAGWRTFLFFFPKIILPGVVKRPFLIASLYKLLDSFFLKHFHERKQFLLKHLHLKKKKKRIWQWQKFIGVRISFYRQTPQTISSALTSRVRTIFQIEKQKPMNSVF